MSLESDISYVYEKVLLKVHQRRKGKVDIIYKEDYLPLNLSNKQLNILRKMCKAQGIKLEEVKYRLPSIEDEELFNEYNEIKRIMDADSKPQEEHPLNSRRIEIRNKIVMDNLALVRTIIDRNYDGINKVPNKEDIYQLGYKILLNYVENGNILKPRYFTLYISSKLIYDIKEQLLIFDKGINNDSKELLEKIQTVRKTINDTSQTSITEQISSKLNVKKKKIEEYLSLENLLEAISIDEATESLNDEPSDEHDNSPLYDNSFEEQLIKSTAREIIIKLLNTLPQNQREVLMLSYGFKDGRCYNDIEIAKMFDVTKARIGAIRHDALESLSLSIRKQYLQDYYAEEYSKTKEEESEKQLKVLEEILIEYISKEELLEYLNHIPERERAILILHYGLSDGIKYDTKSISEKLKISLSSVFSLKNKAYQSLKNEILKEYTKDDKTQPTYREYLEYLIETYIIHNSPKRKR